MRMEDAEKQEQGPSLKIETYLIGGRLQINADVGPDDFGLLTAMLIKYEEILSIEVAARKE